MTRLKCDVLVHYDEQAQRITFYAVPLVGTDDIRQSAFCPLAQDVAHFAAMDPAGAERSLGETVFSYLERHGNKSLGIRDYDAVARDVHYQTIATLQQRVMRGDADAVFQTFQHLHMLALKEKSGAHLASAEQALQSASSLGHAQALALIAVWPKLKADAERAMGIP
jgi:hypothetical protein